MRSVLTIIPVGDAAVRFEGLAAAPRLEELQGGVGGDIPRRCRTSPAIRASPASPSASEAGKLDGLPVNRRATILWHGQRINDYLVGPIVIVTGDKALMRAL